MSYQVLARKWRPRTFQDLVGQEHVLRVLMNALDRQRLHQAYLFAGTRGVGKTTLARIFAKCLNCEVKLSATPCGVCVACRAIDAGQFLDLYEIDAASRTKVEDTRDLLENVAYPPVQGRYKVYLIDEVHMLSGHSFNALLKTLEEPPPQVMFIFATTEPKKLPITILSRCLQFHLKTIQPQAIAAQLQRICLSEQVSFEEKALTALAVAADGSLRDALSLLDQAIVFCQEIVNYTDVQQMLGCITQDEVVSLLQALASREGKRVFKVLAALHQRAPDYHHVLAECLTLLHQAAIVQIVPGQPVSETINALAQKFSAEEIQLYYQIALLGRKDLAYAPSPAQGFEMIMLRMLAFRPAEAAVAPLLSPPPSACISPPTLPQAAPARVRDDNKALDLLPPVGWRELLAKLGLTGLAQALALNCNFEKMEGDKISLVLAASYKPMVNQKLIERIEQALSSHFGKKLKLNITITADEVYSPAKQQQAEQELRRASALESLQQDPSVQKIKTLFNAKLDSQSVEVGDNT
jgi:DNA polymerase-3 subunit gamma/tau